VTNSANCFTLFIVNSTRSLLSRLLQQQYTSFTTKIVSPWMVSKFRNDKVQSTLNGQSPHHTCQLLSGINICWSSSWWTSTVLTATGPGWHPWGQQSVASSKPWAYKWVWVKLFQWNSIQFSEHCARNWFNLKTITLVPHRFVHHRETPFTLGTTSRKHYLASKLSTSSVIQAKRH